MTRYAWSALLLLSLVRGIAAEEPPRIAADAFAQSVVAAVNEGSAEDLHRRLTPKLQKDIPLPQLRRTLLELQECIGKILSYDPRKSEPAAPEKAWHVYRIKAEHATFDLKVKVGGEGQIQEFDFAPLLTPTKVAATSIEALVQVYNAESAEALAELLPERGRSEKPLRELQGHLRQQRKKYGRIASWSESRASGNQHFCRARGEQKAFTFRVLLDVDGRLLRFQFGEPWSETVSPGPLGIAELKEQITEAVEQARAEYHVPSLSLVLVKKDRLVWAKAFGHMNLARKIEADPETVYVTGSICKVMVATAVMQLVEDGKLRLDDPVNQHLKDFQVPNPFEKEAPLTVRHLLAHHGGIARGYTDVPLWKRQLPTPLDELVRKIRVESRPGEKHQYSNLGYALNGYLVSRLSGTSVEEAMQRRLFQPLGMAATSYEPTPAMVENLAVPYQLVGGAKLKAIPYIRMDVYPAGELYSTPSDVARFLIPHLNGGKHPGKQVLSEQSIAEMARVPYTRDKDGTGQGLGWVVKLLKGRRVLLHDGALPGFVSLMVIDPKQQVGLVLFINKRSGSYEYLTGRDTDTLPNGLELAGWILELLDRYEEAVPPADK